MHTWGYTVYCPAGSMTTEICPGGSICNSAATIETCMEGYYCKEGANESIR